MAQVKPAGELLTVEPAPQRFVAVPVPDGFQHEEELKRLAHLAATLLLNGMPERELARRLTRYHPMVEG